MKNKGRIVVAVLVLGMVFSIGDAFGSGQFSLKHASSGSSENSNLPQTLDYSSVNDVYTALKNNYDGTLTTSQLLDGLKQGLASATGDTHTEYFNPTQAKQFQDQLNGTFSGIGAELGKDASGNLQIVAPISGSPADKAGLKAGDLIAQINGVATTGIQIDDAVSKIRGNKGTKVTLQIVRAGQAQTITITRDDITVPSVTTKTLDNNIGYMQISQFSDDTSALAAKAAQQFASQKVNGVVLDLRSNPGGLLDAAVNVSSLWLPAGKTVLQEKRGSQVVNSYVATGGNVLSGVPTVVLIDAGSASASEITAGALKDNGVATLVGTKSYGKGSVQTIQNLSDGSELKVTIARWYRPNGQNIDKKGITPDQTVDLTAANTANAADPQLAAALAKLNH